MWATSPTSRIPGHWSMPESRRSALRCTWHVPVPAHHWALRLPAVPGQIPEVAASLRVTTGGLFSHLAVQKPRAGRIGRPFA